MNEQDIFNRIRLITDKLTQKQQLQSLAKSNGIEINELELTEDTADAVVISVIALMLAKMNQDERYRKLCDFGMQKRSLKVEIINDYKQRANMLYNQFKTGNMTPVTDIVDDVPYDESYVNDDINDDYFDESSKTRKELTKKSILGSLIGSGGTIVLGFTAACLVPFVHMTLLELIAASAIGGGIGSIVGNNVACKDLVPSKYAKNVVESIGDVLATMVKTEDEDVVTNIRKFKKANKNLFDELKFWLPSSIKETKNDTWNSLPSELKRSHEDLMNLCSKMNGLKGYSKSDVKEYVEAINDLLNKTVKITKSGETAIQEGFGFTTKKNICNRVCEQIDIIDPFLKELHKKLDAGEIRDPKTFRKWYRQDVKVSYGYTGGSTTSGDSFGGTTYSYEYGEPTLENYIGRVISVLRMSTRDRYVGKVFTSSEHTMLTELHELLGQMKKDMTSACKDGFNTFKEYNPNVYKNTLTKIIEELTKWDEQSKDVYDMCTKKLG